MENDKEDNDLEVHCVLAATMMLKTYVVQFVPNILDGESIVLEIDRSCSDHVPYICKKLTREELVKLRDFFIKAVG